jgi:formamidopyrimidine-DNA glycosylase
LPELPEVENFARRIHAVYAGHALESVTFHREGLRYPFDKKALARALRPGAILRSVGREGKQIVFRFDDAKLFASLGMSGAFVPARKGSPLKHEHVTFYFRGIDAALGYVDPRRFGFLSLESPPAAASPLEVDALKKTLTDLSKGGSRRRLRDVLLDQRVVAGVGNIYMCEACFAARVDPCLPIADLSPVQIRTLAKSLPKILHKAIELGGSSISTYRQFDGSSGGAQQIHKVYGQDGEACSRPGCKGVIARAVVGGRSVFFCPRCQN